MKDYFKVYEDFPIKGVSFLDINPILVDKDKKAEMEIAIRKSVDIYKEVDKVLVMESRGFIFGNFIANYLNAGLVLARKPSKLPGLTVKTTYFTEYSSDQLAIQLESIKFGERVIIHDDVLATGGTALAAAKLVRELGGEVIGFNFIGEIVALDARSKLSELADVGSVIKF